MPELKHTKARVPPRWFIQLFWIAHRCLYRWTRGRFGLWQPKPRNWGTIRLNTIGRRTGQLRSVIVGYFEDGPNLVTMAMNGWGDPDPAWWLNLQTEPDVTVDTVDGTRRLHARAAQGDERERLWARWQQLDKNLDAYAARRSRRTTVVVLEPDPAHEHETAAAASHQQRIAVTAGEEGRRHGHPNN